VPHDVFLIGIDIEKTKIKKSLNINKNKGQFFLVASVMNLPFMNDKFDLILCIDVLEHVSDNERTIDEFHFTMKKTGRLVGSTTNVFNPVLFFDSYFPQSIVKAFVNKYAGQHYERHSRFSPPSLIKAVSKSGFKLIYLFLVGFPPFPSWIYEFSDKKIPFYSYFWILFNEITNMGFLRILKENMVFEIMKK